MYYGLVLSFMRDEKYEYSDRLVAYSESKDVLQRFYDSEKVEPWVDDNPEMANLNGTREYRKAFRKDGPLEWFNPTSARHGEDFLIPIDSPEEFANRVVRTASDDFLRDNGYEKDLERLRRDAMNHQANFLAQAVKME